MDHLLIYYISYPFTSLSSIILGSFVYLKNPKSTVHRMWFATCIAVSLWAGCSIFYFLILIEYQTAIIFARIANVSAIFIPVFFTHFCLLFLGKALNKILGLGYIFAFFILLTSFTKYFIPSIHHFGELYYFPTPGPIYHLFTTAFLYYTFYSEFTLFNGLKTSSPTKKNQIKYFLISTTIAFICGITTLAGVYHISISTFPSNFTSIYAITISFAIIKHNLLDIDVAIRKGLVYSILISLITIIYVVIALLIENTFRGIIGYKSIPLTIVTTTLIVILFQPLKNRIQRFIDKYFFKGSIIQIDEENIKLREELQKSEKLKAVATLAAGMAHEIKNPLTSIKTFTEHLSRKSYDKLFIEKFEKIVVPEVDRINKIVKELLDFAKPGDLKLSETDLNTLLDETISLLNNDFLKHGIKLEKHYEALPQVTVDPSQMKQVFLNLLLNAIDAMPSGGIVTVKTNAIPDRHCEERPEAAHRHCEAPKGPKQSKIMNSTNPINSHGVCVAITDTGCGISKDDLKHIFDPFFTRKDGGTGLGLSVVHGIIKKHGGKIEVISKINKGTEFKITLK